MAGAGMSEWCISGVWSGEHDESDQGGARKRPRAVHLEGYWEPLDDVRYRVVNNAFIPSLAQQRDASVKNIRVNAEAYARLRKMRRSGESVSALVERLAFELTS